jgi:hybrid polyketide synthase/nonribosomal peptide synthetase ACE1
MRPDGMLDDFYSDSLGLPATNRYLSRMIMQLAHRYPRMNLIEIGESILNIII